MIKLPATTAMPRFERIVQRNVYTNTVITLYGETLEFGAQGFSQWVDTSLHHDAVEMAFARYDYVKDVIQFASAEEVAKIVLAEQFGGENDTTRAEEVADESPRVGQHRIDNDPLGIERRGGGYDPAGELRRHFVQDIGKRLAALTARCFYFGAGSDA